MFWSLYPDIYYLVLKLLMNKVYMGILLILVQKLNKSLFGRALLGEPHIE